MRKISKSGYKRKCDKLWGEIIHKLYKNRCCIEHGKEALHHAGNIEAHHLISRSILANRHDPRNGITLCSLHHKYSKTLSPHGAPFNFCDYVSNYRAYQKEWYSLHHYDCGHDDISDIFTWLSAFSSKLDEIGCDRMTHIMFENPKETLEKMVKRVTSQ